MSCTDIAKMIGRRALFLGVDTANWNLAQFAAAARFAHVHHIDALFVKTCDGGNRWYQWSGDNIDGWRSIRQTILQNGVGAIPYTYSYGNTYNALTTEIALLQEYMRDAGVVIADMEDKWNGHADWAAQLCSSMKAVPGIFLVSTWANPDQQNWQGVIQALNPCVDAYLPQQYTNYLASCWGQFGALGAACIMPTFMIEQDFGPNDAVANAHAAYSQGHAAMSLWYYDPAVANPGLLDQILAAFPVSTTTPTPPPQEGNVTIELTTPGVSTFFAPSADGYWRCLQTQHRIGGSILSFYKRFGNDDLCGLTHLGLPLSDEITIGNGVTAQPFERGVLINDPKYAVDQPAGTSNTVYTAHLDRGFGNTWLASAIQSKLTALQGEYNSVVSEKNQLVGEKAALQKQVADLEAQLKAVQTTPTQTAIDQAAADIQTAITAEQASLKALGK
jgi:Uncharacterized protein conserved in bacteria